MSARVISTADCADSVVSNSLVLGNEVDDDVMISCRSVQKKTVVIDCESEGKVYWCFFVSSLVFVCSYFSLFVILDSFFSYVHDYTCTQAEIVFRTTLFR